MTETDSFVQEHRPDSTVGRVFAALTRRLFDAIRRLSKKASHVVSRLERPSDSFFSHNKSVVCGTECKTLMSYIATQLLNLFTCVVLHRWVKM